MDATEPRPRNKRLWASVQRKARAVTEEVFQEALRPDPERQRPWVMVVYGQPRQLDQIESCIIHHGVGGTPYSRISSTCSNIFWSAAFLLYSKGREETEAWVLERALQILHGKASDVEVGMRRNATLGTLW